MKDQYVGDVKDYFKYGLLRALSGPHLPMVVCWMLTPPDAGRDGRKIEYLRDAGFRRFDPALVDAMQSLVGSGTRRVAAIEASDLLAATFVSHLRDLSALDPPRSLIFFDPDVGFEVGSVGPGSPRAEQYLYWTDAKELFGRGHSLLVFQHWQHRAWAVTLARIAGRAGVELGCASVSGYVTRRGVAFVLLRQPDHEALEREAAAFVERWAPEVDVWTAS